MSYTFTKPQISGYIISSPVDANWTKTIDTFASELKRKNIAENHITMITDVADNNAVKILNHVKQEEPNYLHHQKHSQMLL